MANWWDEYESEPQAPKVRSPWQRFKDSFLEGALHSPAGAEGVVRRGMKISGKTDEEINRAERKLSDRFASRRAQDEEGFKDVDTLSPANIGKHAVDLLGNIFGGADPTYVLAPGRSALQRMGAQGAINAGMDAGSQVVEKRRGVRDEIDPDQIAISGAGGLVLQGAGEVAGRAKANRAIARGGQGLDLDSAVGIGNKFGRVTSTVRSPSKNKKVGGVKNSFHLTGQAIDIARGKGVTHKQIENAYRRAGFDIIESLDEGDHSHLAFNFKKPRDKAREARIKERGRKMASMNEEELEAQFSKDQSDFDQLAEEARIAIESLDDFNYRSEDDHLDLNDDFFLDEMTRRFNDDPNYKPTGPETERLTEIKKENPQSYWGNFEAVHNKGTVIPLPDVRGGKDVDNFMNGMTADRSNIPNLEDVRNKKFETEVDAQYAERHSSLENAYWQTRHILDAVKEGRSPLSRGEVEEKIATIQDVLDQMSKSKNLREFIPITEDTLALWKDMHLALGGKPAVPTHTPKGLGKGSVATTPVNDLREIKTQFSRIEADNIPEHLNIIEFKLGQVTGDLTFKNGDTEAGFNISGDGANSLDLKSLTKLAKDIKEAYPELKTIRGIRMSGARAKNPKTIRADLTKLASRFDETTKPNRNAPPARPAFPGEEGFPKPGEPGNRGGPYGGDGDGPKDFSDIPPEERLTKFLKKASPLNYEQRQLYSAERSKRAAQLSRLQQQGGGRENLIRQKASQKGQLPRADFDSFAEHFTEDDFTALANKINFAKTLLPYQKLNALEALEKLLSPTGAKLPIPSEIKLLSEVYSKDFIDALLDNRPLMAKLKHGAVSTLNIPRALMASVDVSAPFRQGIMFIHKKEFWKSMIPMFRVLVSEKNSRLLMESIKTHPNWDKAVQAKLAIVDPHSHFLADREEAFMSDYAEKVPGVGRLVKGSNRAYSGFLNKLRFDVFNDLVSKYEATGVALDKKKLREIANFINYSTGRGSLGKQGNAAAPALSGLFFSPRLMASRFQILNPTNYVKADPLLRAEALKSAMAYSAYMLTILGVAKYALGAQVEMDPRSSDFAKIRVGDTRIDATGGLQSYVRLYAQIISNSKITQKGEEKDLGGGRNAPGKGPYDESIADVVGRFFRSKESPLASFVHNFADGENVVGEPFSRTKKVPGTDVGVNAEVAERFIPMTINDLVEVFNDRGFLTAAGLAVPALMGVGVQTYKPKEPKEKKSNSSDWWKDYEQGKSSTDNWWKEYER